MNNKYILFHNSPKKHPLICVSFILTITIIGILSYKVKTYDSYKTTGIITCNDKCTIQITLPYDKIDIFRKDTKILYLRKEYKILNIVYEEPYLNNGIPYQDIVITTDLKSKDRLINFNIIYNKQRIIRKIKNIIERE